MQEPELRVTYIGGPTALLEFDGCRLLTDPTFDQAGTDYPTTAYTLHKTSTPAIVASALGAIDVVLLSHDHHFDNLDHAGRDLLARVPAVFTTLAGAERLGGAAIGLAPGQTTECRGATGRAVSVTATPARHGPAGGDRGPVIGFLLEAEDRCVYFSGDTVWYKDVEAIGLGRRIDVALLNLGAAKVAVAGPSPLTFTAVEAVSLARAWPDTTIVPLHFEGWQHFTEGRADIDLAFEQAGLAARLQWLQPGQATVIRST